MTNVLFFLQLYAPIVSSSSIPTANFKKQNIMKTSLILIASATLTPALILVGLSTTAAFGLFSIIGVSAMISQDYGPKSSYHQVATKVAAKVAAKPVEAHPFAA